MDFFFLAIDSIRKAEILKKEKWQIPLKTCNSIFGEII